MDWHPFLATGNAVVVEFGSTPISDGWPGHLGPWRKKLIKVLIAFIYDVQYADLVSLCNSKNFGRNQEYKDFGHLMNSVKNRKIADKTHV